MSLSSRQRLAASAIFALAAIHISVQVFALCAFRALPHEIPGFSEDRTWRAAALRISTEPLGSVFDHSDRTDRRRWSGVVTHAYVVLTNPGTSLVRKAVVFAFANTAIYLSVAFLCVAVTHILLRRRFLPGPACDRDTPNGA